MAKGIGGGDPHQKEWRVAREKEVPPGGSRKFTLKCHGRRIDAMVINSGGSYHAYVNLCRHIPMSLDWVDNQFFTRDGKFLMCATHGALYAPKTGQCVWGPPVGEFLIPVPIEVRDGSIFAQCPDLSEA